MRQQFKVRGLIIQPAKPILTLVAIERLIKTAIVDKTPSVSSAALVSSYHLLPVARDVVRRWQSETQEAASSSKSSGGFSLGFGGSSHTNLQTSTNVCISGLHESTDTV
jgi:coatomer protein complex subunit gamma